MFNVPTGLFPRMAMNVCLTTSCHNLRRLGAGEMARWVEVHAIQARSPELNPTNLHEGRKTGLTLQSYLLTLHMCTKVFAPTHTYHVHTGYGGKDCTLL